MKRLFRRSCRGATLIEMGVALFIFSFLSLLLAMSFTKSNELWQRTSGGASAQHTLRKLRNRLSRDLSKTSFESVETGVSLNSIGGGPDGSAIWFLSPVNDTTGDFVRTSTGTPFWQHHILYYAVVPGNHNTFVGFNCQGSAGSAGFEVQCPHKVVIRKVIDTGALVDLADESTIEIPMSEADPVIDVTNYLTRPQGLDTSGMSSEPGLISVSIVSTNVLSFQASVGHDPAQPREIKIETASVSIPSAQKLLTIGQVPLEGTIHESTATVLAHPHMP